MGVENIVAKEEIACFEQFSSPLPQFFQMSSAAELCQNVSTSGKGLRNI